MLTNIAFKGLKGLAHGIIGFVAYSIFVGATHWLPPTTNPLLSYAWQTVGIGLGVGLSQALGRTISYDPTKDPNAPK